MAMNPRLLRPRATGFNPKSISGLVGWWDASDSATVTLNSGNVSAWADKSGNGRTLSQATAANQPAYTTGAVNGRNAIVWPSTTNGRTLGVASAFTVQQYAIVCRLGDGGSTLSDFRGLLSAPANIGLLVGSSTANWWPASGSDFPLMRRNGAAEASIDAAPAVPMPLSVLLVRSNSAISRQLILGGERSNTSRSWWGPICEVLAFSSTLNAAATSAVERYLARKWGVTLP